MKMPAFLKQIDLFKLLSNSKAWCLLKQRVEQPSYQKMIILVAVCIALLLDNMLYMVIVPIIPDYLRHIGAWSTHKVGGDFEFKIDKQINDENHFQAKQSILKDSFASIQINDSLLLNNMLSFENMPPYLIPNASYDELLDKNLEQDAMTTSSQSKNIPALNSFKNKSHFPYHSHMFANRIGGKTIYEGEDTAIGMLFSSKAMIQLIINPFSGAIIDCLGYDRPMMFGLTVMFFSTVIFACGRSYKVLFLARSLQGVGSAFADTGGFAMIADRFTVLEEREKALGIALSFVSFGCLFGPPFGSFLYEFFGKELPFILLSLICLLDGLLVLLIIHTYKTIEPKNINDQHDQVSIKLNQFKQDLYPNSTISTLTFQSSSSTGSQPSSQSSSFHPCELQNESFFINNTTSKKQKAPIYVLFRDRLILVCAGALVVANVSLAFLEPTISIWMQDTMHVEEWQIGMVWLPSFFPYVFGVYFTVKYNHKYPGKQYLLAITGLALNGISCLFIPFASNYYQLFLPISILCFGVAVIDTAVFPTLAYIVDTRYVSVYGSIYAIADISYSIAYAFGPIIAGEIMKLFGFTWLNILIAAIVVAYCPMLLTLKHVQDYDLIDENCNLKQTSSFLMQKKTSVKNKT